MGRIVFGRWSDGGEAGEELVVSRRSATRVEIHCHGGQAAAAAIIRSLICAGCCEIDGPTWAARHEQDRLAAQARAALCEARTLRTAAILLDQHRGALRTALERIHDLLCGKDAAQATEQLSQIEQYADLGVHLTTPWRVVFAGRVNVGKSSLINAVLGYPRSIVHPGPGTTRDLVTALTALGGWPVELADTAGLRCASDPVESAGVSRAISSLAAADLVALVFDASQAWSSEDDRLVQSTPKALIVHNKCDLLSQAPEHPPGLLTSAKTGLGIRELTDSVVRRLASFRPPPGAAVPFAARHVEGLRSALANVRRGDLTAAAADIANLL
jgi:tRNA modification GTPase